MRIAAALLLASSLAGGGAHARERIVVASKNFTESVVLGEVVRLLAREEGFAAEHRKALGGTRIVFNALAAGEVDVYVEYTGTLANEIFAGRDVTAGLTEAEIALGPRLGFANNYALGMPRRRAEALGIARISDLADHPDLVLRFSNEFLDREDGWPGLRETYRLPQRDVQGVEHDLAYRGIASGAVDLTELYTTDAEIKHYDLRTLEDDRGYFARYDAVILHRVDVPPALVEALGALEGKIDAVAMAEMNARVKLESVPAATVAYDFLEGDRELVTAREAAPSRISRIAIRTVEHLRLVGVSLGAAVLVAIPLGIVAARRPRLGRVLISAVGIGQTVPALAMLVLMIPPFGIGTAPALVALFVYCLLPIVRNTHAGVVGIPRSLIESADALGLSSSARLRHVELPLAFPAILAGVKTAAVINVGAATLGALVGAGGYGQPILTGIRLDDWTLILEGALPAAGLALLVEWALGVLAAAVQRGSRNEIPAPTNQSSA